MKSQTLIGLAIVALLAVIAINSFPKPSTDTPGWHKVMECDAVEGDAYYSPGGWCPIP